MDEPAKEAPKAQPQPPGLVERAKASPVTFAIAAINVAVFVWVESHGSTLDIGTLLRFGANERMHVVSGEWWRLGSYMFLHIGWVHLLWNTYASIGWSTTVEKALGRLRYVAVYLLSGLGAGCVSAIAQHAVSAGASGAMFGMVGAAFVLRYRTLGSWAAFTRDRYVRTNAINIGIWIAIGLTAVKMDNWAHGGGLAVGAIATFIATMKEPAKQRLGWLGAVALVASLFVAALRPGYIPTEDDAKLGASYVAGYALGIEKFPHDAPRAERLADLVCRRPASVGCAQAGWALRDGDDPATHDKGKDLLARSCQAGNTEACGDLPPIRSIAPKPEKE